MSEPIYGKCPHCGYCLTNGHVCGAKVGEKMSEIKRYDVTKSSMEYYPIREDDRGSYVLYGDHIDALQAERDIVREIAKDHAAALRQAKIDMAKRCAEIIAQIEHPKDDSPTKNEAAFHEYYNAIRAEAAKE